MYEIRLSEGVERDLRAIRAHYRGRVLDAIEEQLTQKPNVATKNRKILVNLNPPFEAVPPLWELRVGANRIFYDVAEEEGIVSIRAIRHKPPHKSTEEIL